MKTIKNILKNSPWAKLSALFTLIVVVNLFSMRMPEISKKFATSYWMKKQQQEPIQPTKTEAEQKQELEEAFMSDADLMSQKAKKLKTGEFLVYEADTTDGIVVPWHALKISITMKNLVEDLGSSQEGQIAIPITACPFATIQLVFNALIACTNNFNNTLSLDTLERTIQDFSLEKLVEMANALTFFDVPQEMLIIVAAQIKNWMESNSKKIINNETLKRLNPDLQKSIMVEPSINYLKNCIIKKNTTNKPQWLSGHPRSIKAVAFSPDGTHIVSGCFGYQNNIILWNISNPDKITQQTLVGQPENVYAVAFSPDGTHIVSGCDGNQNNLILWNISNPDKITQITLIGHPKSVYAVAFSPDGTKIVSGYCGTHNNLILWDISNPDKITQQNLDGHQNSVFSVAFSPDGTKILSGGYGNQNNLILWDISNSDKITQQNLIGHPSNVDAVAFSPDGTKIVSGYWGTHNNLILWDISNPDKITQIALVDHPDTVKAVAFSPDGTKIVSGYWGTHNNLILWDISNPDKITQQNLDGHSDSVLAVAFSPNGKQIVSGGRQSITTIKNNLLLWTLLTNQEELLINQIKNYNADQVRVIYQLCLSALNGEKMAFSNGSQEQKIFKTLPQDMQKLLTNLFAPQGWLSNWW